MRTYLQMLTYTCKEIVSILRVYRMPGSSNMLRGRHSRLLIIHKLTPTYSADLYIYRSLKESRHLTPERCRQKWLINCPGFFITIHYAKICKN